MLDVQAICVNYDDREVLRDVSLTLRDGEIVALLGPNGAGKTTLIRTLNGTVATTAGSISLDGRNLADMSRREIAANTAVVAQENETRFPITVLEFILSGRFVHGGAFGWETERDLEFARRALFDCDLSGFESRFMNHLSGGERQRVVLARALATDAKILLLDEPTANLDLSHQAMMFRLVRERCRSCGASAVVITHDLNLAAEFADEIVMLKNGCVAANGRSTSVLTKDAVREVFGVKVMVDEHPMSGNVRVTSIF
jgi:iron complex transport system ATP-binding protein